MLQSDNDSKMRVGARQRFCQLFVGLMVIFALIGVCVARAQDRSLDNLRNLNQSVDALIKKVSPAWCRSS